MNLLRRCLVHVGPATVALALALSGGSCNVHGQAPVAQDPIFGTWKMDLGKSVNNRGGDHRPYTRQATRVLEAVGDGLRNTYYTSPTDSSPNSYIGHFDGKDYPDPRNPERQETLAHWRVGRDVIVRLRKAKGVPSEWVIYTVSPDGSTFVSTSWVPSHPELQDVQVFTRAR